MKVGKERSKYNTGCDSSGMLETVDEFEVAALHKWIELISDPDADIPRELGNNFIKCVLYILHI